MKRRAYLSLAAVAASAFNMARVSQAGEPCHYTWTRIFPPPGWPNVLPVAVNIHGDASARAAVETCRL